MARETAYILLHQMSGINAGPPQRDVVQAMKEVEERLLIKMWSWPMFSEHEPSPKWARRRIFFTCPDTKRDDLYAARLAESILLLCELFYGPLYRMDEKYFAFPFWFTPFKKNNGIHFTSLSREVTKALNDRTFLFVDQLLQEYSGIPDRIVALALRAAPILQSNESLRMATAFISKSQHDFYVYPGQLQEAIHDGDWMPTGAYELAQWEAAFHNSYKAVEAVIGDPPKDEMRFLSKLTAMGLDPFEQVGYTTKEPLSKVLRDMNRIRDSKVAHGSTTKRGIRLNQMVEFRECAIYVVQQALDCAYGGNLSEIT